jgi:oligopeptide/dipeptide ABC transporter ATP-binding protein
MSVDFTSVDCISGEFTSGEFTGGDLLAITNLGVHFGALEILGGVSLSVGRGQIAAIVGESGSGKSVLARSVLGLAGRGARVSGSVKLLGEELTSLGEAALTELRGGTVSLMVQDAQSALNPVYRIGAQMMEMLALKHPRFSAEAVPLLDFGRRRRRRAEMRLAALELLDEVGMENPQECFRAFPHQLSGGMCQRVMLAMAMLGGPRLLIADEPTTALDVVMQKQILGRLVESARRRLSSVILISHDLHLVGELADELIVFYAGRIMEQGPAARVLSRPANPYTRGLLASTPGPDTPKGSLAAIPGEVPSPGRFGPGCRFRGRCPEEGPGCASEPTYRSVGERWRSLCHQAASVRAKSPAAMAA